MPEYSIINKGDKEVKIALYTWQVVGIFNGGFGVVAVSSKNDNNKKKIEMVRAVYSVRPFQSENKPRLYVTIGPLDWVHEPAEHYPDPLLTFKEYKAIPTHYEGKLSPEDLANDIGKKLNFHGPWLLNEIVNHFDKINRIPEDHIVKMENFMLDNKIIRKKLIEIVGLKNPYSQLE